MQSILTLNSQDLWKSYLGSNPTLSYRARFDPPVGSRPSVCVRGGLLLGEGDLHGVGLRDLEALQGVSGGPRLHVVIKLHEGDVVAPRDQTHLLEAREPGGGRGGGVSDRQGGTEY